MAFILTRPASPGAGAGGIPGLSITNINGQPTLTLQDSTRGNKNLSVSENPLVFSENVLQNNDWIQIGTASDADTAYVAEFDGTIVYASGMCENVNNNDKNIHLYINSVDYGSIGLLSGPGLDTFINTTLNIDFNQGDMIRLRAMDGIAGRIQDTVIKIILKWRG